MFQSAHLKLRPRTAGIQSTFALDQTKFEELCADIRGKFAEDFPEVAPRERGDAGKDRNVYTQRLPTIAPARQRALQLSPDSMNLVWADNTTDDDARKYLETACTSVERFFKLQLLGTVDTQYVYEFETAANHYDIIHRMCFAGASFGELCRDGRKHLTNDVEYRLLLGDERVAILRLIGGHSDLQVLHGSLSPARLRVSASIGQTHGFSAKDKSLYGLLDAHLVAAEKFVQEDFIPKILRRLDDELTKLAG